MLLHRRHSYHNREEICFYGLYVIKCVCPVCVRTLTRMHQKPLSGTKYVLCTFYARKYPFQAPRVKRRHRTLKNNIQNTLITHSTQTHTYSHKPIHAVWTDWQRFFQSDFCERPTRFLISDRDFQRFLMSDLPLGLDRERHKRQDSRGTDTDYTQYTQ